MLWKRVGAPHLVSFPFSLMEVRKGLPSLTVQGCSLLQQRNQSTGSLKNLVTSPSQSGSREWGMQVAAQFPLFTYTIQDSSQNPASYPVPVSWCIEMWTKIWQTLATTDHYAFPAMSHNRLSSLILCLLPCCFFLSAFSWGNMKETLIFPDRAPMTNQRKYST